MKKNQKFGLVLFTISLAFILLACGLTGGSDQPTLAPAAAEPTAVPVEPTEPPASQPTEESNPADVPTDAPMEEPTEEPTEEPISDAPVENALYIAAVNGYRDDTSALHIVGLVTNNTDRAVDNIEIEIEILDRDGNSLYVDTIYASLYTLAPGETTPFASWVYEELPDADSYVATIVGQSAAEVERASVTVEGVTLVTDDSGGLHITGSLVNNTETPINIDGLAAATFDENGELFTADSHSVIVRYLDPGEDGPFRVTMTGPEEGSANINEYEIYMDAEVSEPYDSFDLAFSESQYHYMDVYDSFHLVGEITNNHDEFLTVSLVAGIYDADGNVIDAATTDTPTFSIAPGETLPYDFQYWGPLNYKFDAIDTASSYTVQWDPYWTWTSTTEYVDLITQNDVNEVSAYQATFTGEVLNNTTSEVNGATVIVSLYDIETGELVATGYGGIYDPIVPNGIAEYSIWIDIPNDFDINAVEYEIIAKGDLP